MKKEKVKNKIKQLIKQFENTPQRVIIKPRYWWQWFSVKWWRNRKAVKLFVEYQMNDPKYRKSINKLMAKPFITGEQITKEDIKKAIKKLK